MPNKMMVFAMVVLLAFVALLTYTILTQPEPGPGSRKPRPPRRWAAAPFQRFQLRPSGGLAWSKARYPEQYRPANMKTAEFVGRELDGREQERFLDIAGRAYSRAVLDGFSYTDPDAAKKPGVVVEYLSRAETFVGRIKGTGLKPNFAYQIKLWGKYAEAPEGFEKIGRTGRWRLPGRGTNYSDKDYEEFPDKELVEAYLLFDFFVSDSEGKVDKEFYADSSLHVLWNASVQRSPRASDGCQIPIIRANSDLNTYANPKCDLGLQRLYAESEQHMQGKRDHRKPIGRAFLPVGTYKAEVVLTEESFHGWGDMGRWATVLTAPVEFEVIDQPRPEPIGETGNLIGTPLSLESAELIDIDVGTHTVALIEGMATSDDPMILFDEEIEFNLGERHVFAVEIKGFGRHTWQLFINVGGGFERRPTYSFTTRGRDVWQRYEVEITSMVEGRTARFCIAPATRTGFIGVRRAGIYTIKD